jgi:hypothetical protein
MIRSLPLVAALAVCLAPSFAASAVPTDAKGKADLIGSPTGLTVEPASVALSGTRSRAQVVVTGKYADGTVRDLTHVSSIACESADLVSISEGFLTPKKAGASALVVKAGAHTVKVPVSVKDLDKGQPASFRNEVIAAFNVGGCNSGACHGTPSGKGGFKLSLRGFDPDLDYQQLTRDVLGRRTERQTPDASLVLLKALGQIPHEGGQRFQTGGVAWHALRAWLAEGLQDDAPKLPTVTKVEVLPGSRVQTAPARFQQLAVLATFSDGTVRDVTRLTVFSSSDTSVADVNLNGLVEFRGAGEVAILARFLMELNTVRLTYLEPKPGFVWSNPPEVNSIDKHTFAKLKMLSIAPSDLCTDAEFVRRAYLDAIGVLPTAAEARAFLSDPSPGKRAKLVDALLERPEYADYWTMKWSDVFRSSRKTIQVKGTHVFQRWLKENLRKDTGFDKVTRELITANGSTFANPPANYYRIARDSQSLAETTAQLFFGIRMQCAKCHNHPFERWTQDDYYSMAAWFAQVRQKPDRREPGMAPAHQQGDGPEVPRRGDPEDPGPHRPPRSPRRMADLRGQPVLRQEHRQPRLVSPHGQGHRRSRR